MDTDATRPTGAQRLVASLERLGVEQVFGLPGVHNLPVWDAIASTGIRMVGVHHEQTAAYAADGFARATGRLGVAVVTTGPGAANTLAAVGEAWASGSPVMVIATDISTVLRRDGAYRGVLHETRDQQAMFAPVVKAAWTVASADDIASTIQHAAAVALTAPTGPVYIGVPTNLLSASAPDSSSLPVAVEPASVASADIARAAAVLNNATRPLVWAGGGAMRSGAGAVIGELASLIAAPVVTTWSSRGLLPPDHPCLLPGPVHAPEAGMLWDEADVVLAIGTDFDGMMTQNWLQPAPRTMIAINIDAADASKNYAADVTLVGDARTVTSQLICELTSAGDERGSHLAARLADIRVASQQRIATEEPHAAALVDTLDRVLPHDAVVVADMCIAGYWYGGYGRIKQPRGLAYPMGWGTLGFAFPASIGAAFAGRGRSVCIAGDGGFLFACGELATLARERPPVTVIIVDDDGYGMLRYDQQHAGTPTRGVDWPSPDFVAMAHACTVDAVCVDGFGDDFEKQLTAFLDAPGPNVLVVKAAMQPPCTTSPRWYRRPAT